MRCSRLVLVFALPTVATVRVDTVTAVRLSPLSSRAPSPSNHHPVDSSPWHCSLSRVVTGPEPLVTDASAIQRDGGGALSEHHQQPTGVDGRHSPVGAASPVGAGAGATLSQRSFTTAMSMAWSECAVVAVKDLSATTLDVASTGESATTFLGIFNFPFSWHCRRRRGCVQLGSLLASVDVVQRMS